MELGPDARCFLQRLAARDTLDEAAHALGNVGLSAVVLKGAWLLDEVYPDTALRPITDVDLLVAPGEFRQVQAALTAAGFMMERWSSRQLTLRQPQRPLAIDLHRRLFPRGTFRLTADAMLQRSRPSTRRGLRFPHALDGLAHLIGHFANNRLLADNLARHEDFERLGQHFELSPNQAASRLVGAGMSRAGRYVLDSILLAQETNGDDASMPFCRALRTALPSDPWGELIVGFCRRTIAQVDPTQPLGAILSCLLQDSATHTLAASLGRPLEHAQDVLAQRVQSAVR